MIGTVQGFMDWAVARGFDFSHLTPGPLSTALANATQALEGMTRRRLEPLEEQTLTAYGHGLSLLTLPEEMTEVTAVSVSGTAYSTSSWVAEPPGRGPVVALRSRYGGGWPEYAEITITGTLGYQDPVPADLVEACYLLVADFLQSSQAGVASVKVADVATTFATGEQGLQHRIMELVKPHVRHL